MKKILFIVTTLIFSLQLLGQDKKFTVAFYNVENLFDTINDPLKNDDDFTPEGKLKWDSNRYLNKTINISKVIMAIGNGEAPAIMGLCEVENREVLDYMIRSTPLKKLNYAVIHEDSPDNRGIDVAMLFRKDIFKPIEHKAISVNLKPDTIKTRDILYVKGVLDGTDTLHVFVNHWPSRIEGEGKSEFKRIQAAKTLRKEIDAIMKADSLAKIIVMGDFNDYPNNKSIEEVLMAKKDTSEIKGKELFNMLYLEHLKGKGSHFYDNQWGMLDQIIISKSLLKCEKNKLFTLPGRADVFNPDWILYTNKDGIKIPKRTYVGNSYKGGYSDHLPVYMYLFKN
jgi:predicted extracellular nuclease